MPSFWRAAFSVSILFCASFVLEGCGRYGKPLPPEYLAPASIKELEVTSAADGVKFSWQSPDHDRRGKDLKTIDGYKVLRKEVALSDSSELEKAGDFSVVATVGDTHLVELEKQKQELLAQEKPARRLKPEAESTTFSFTDSSVVSGKSYLYRIMPFNQGGVLGQSKQTVRVVYSGANTQISILPSSHDGIDSEDLF